MGWQDAPLASPSGPKPAWASAPLATQSDAPAGGGYFGGDGFLSKIGNFIHRADQMSGRGAQGFVSGLERAGQAAAGSVGLDGVADYLGKDAQQGEQQAAAPVAGTTSWEDVKAHPNAGNIASYVGEQGAGAIPSLAAAGVSLPAFAVSRLGDVATRRAENNGQTAPTAADILKAAPSAAIDTVLMRGGLSGILEGGVGKAAVREGIAQGGMPVADYAGETVGTDKGFKPAEAVDRAAAGLVAGVPFGAGAHLGVRGIRALRETYATKGVDTSGMGDEALVEGSLNGSIHPDVGPNDVNAILQSVGSSAEHFSTPDKAAAAAERATAAAGRPNINDLGAKELARQQGITENIAAGETDPAFAPQPVPRTPGPDVTMTAAPEGLIRSDDQGAQVGVQRHNAAQQNVIDTAERHAENDPVLRHVLDSDLPIDSKIGVLMDRFKSRFPQVDLGGDQAPTPFVEPTPQRARDHRIEPQTQIERELAVTKNTESHGDPNAVSSKGARGTMQTMPGTLRDPGYGVRPAANDSPAELERVGRDYYAALRQHYGSAEKAWAAYNAGPGALDGAMHKYGDAWLDHMPEETRNYVRKNVGAIGGAPTETTYRAPPPSDDPFRSDSGFERTDAAEEPLVRDQAGQSRMASGDSSRPFREETDTPDGEANGYWERRAQMHADELRQEWESSRTQPPPAGSDPSQKYGANGYGQRPHQPAGSDTFATTAEGHIADVNGKPVAFRNLKEAATFAAKNKLGGDFDPVVWATNSKRIVLTRRAGSDYGTPRPKGPAEPAAGRSADTGQRYLEAPVEPAGEPPAGETPRPATGEPSPAEDAVRAAEPPLRADHGSVSDPSVPRGTENAPKPAADPKPPRTFLSAVADHLAARSKQTGLRQRIDAQDAINHGVPADSIYIDARAKYPVVKLSMQRVFGTSKGPLKSRAQPAKLHSLDWLGDRFDPAQYGVPGDELHGHRIDPEHAANLLTLSMERHEDSFDRHDARYEPYMRGFDEMKQQDQTENELHELRQVAEHHGIEHDPQVLETALDHVGRGETRETALELAVHEAAANALERGAQHTGDDYYSHIAQELYHGEEAEPRGGGSEEALGGSEGTGAPEDGSGEASPERGGAAEDALIPERPTDQRDTLQRRADEGLKPAADQKAPGSDGGLFDTQDTTGDLLGDKPGAADLKKYDAGELKYAEMSAEGQRAYQNRADDENYRNLLKNEPGLTRDEFEERKAGGMKFARSFLEGGGLDGGKPTKGRGIGGTFKDLLNDEGGALDLGKIAESLFEKDADPGEIIRRARDLASHPKETAGGLLRNLDRFGADWTYSSDGALRTLARHYDAPTIAKVADLFQSRRGKDDATGRTYDEAIARQIGLLINKRLHTAVDPFVGDKLAMDRIRDLLADPGRTVRAKPAEIAAARQLRDLLKDVVEYRREAGEDIQAIKDYFPRVVDAIAVAKSPTKFKAAAEKLYRDLGVDDPAKAAEDWMTRILDTDAGINGGEEFARSSGKPSSSKHREFGPAADRLLRDFLQKDPLLVIHDHVLGAIRSAEQSRRFGPKGAVGSKERAEWVKEHGDKTQWAVMQDRIRDEVRASGKEAQGLLDQVAEIRDGAMGRLRGKDVKRSAAVARLHVWNQLAHLQRVTLSSLQDAAMGFQRFGPELGVRHLVGTFKESVRLIESLGKRDPSDARRWAEGFGIVGHTNASSLIQARMDMAPGAVPYADLLNKFYHKIGLEQWTQGGRTDAAECSKIFVRTLADDLMSGSARTRQRAGFYLKELGIREPQSFGEWLRKGPSDTDIASDRGHAADYATAIIRASNDTVLMPNRASKPVWANHPLGSLIFALQSYNAAFTQNVLKRGARLTVKGVKEGDAHILATQALGLTVLLATTAAQDYLRTALFGGKSDKPESATAYALRIMDRASLTGIASPIFNAFGGLKYHRTTGAAIEGSIVGSGVQAADAVGGLFIGNSDKTNSAERKAAGLLYDLVVEPVTNAAGAAYLRGPAGTAAIMGTGNKKGGVLPDDRDAFIDAVGGKGK